MRPPTAALLTFLACLGVPRIGSAQPATAQDVAIEQLMSAKDFADAGLGKLTPDELRRLNQWLGKYTKAVGDYLAGQAPQVAGAPAPTSAVIESRIDGEFQGWEGETIFKLMNGQIWQQSSYAYKYHYAYGPKVLIYKSGSLYKMKVDRVDGEIYVRRLK